MHPLKNAKCSRTQDRFVSDGHEIRLETYVPHAAASGPSLLVLHSATGVPHANRFIAGLAELFARQGFVTHLLHYFDRTGTTFADEDAIAESAGLWLQTVDDAAGWIRATRPAARIGLFGYSLGAHLAMRQCVCDSRVSAAVILAGGLEGGPVPPVRHAPPVLFLHGAKDERVLISDARQWEAALSAAGGEPEFHVYPEEEHLLSLPCYADVVRRGTEFFRRYLID